VTRYFLLLFFALASTPASPLWAQAVDETEARRYADCMTLAGRDPDAAFDEAAHWGYEGGGFPARHCAATALVALGHYAEAATRLEDLAQDMTGREAPLRVGVLRQAGRAWMLDGNYEQALAVQGAALQLEPGDIETLIDRSTVLALAGAYWEAIDDLNRVLERNPDDVGALVMRASAYRFVESAELAMHDVDRALELDPEDIDALLERGNIRRLIGDDDGAREDWVRVLQIAPESVAADGARTNLEKLDVNVEE